MEVRGAIVGIGEESSSLTVEAVAIDPIGHSALTAAKDLCDWASEECREQNSHATGRRHTNIINIRIQRPRSHVADVIASELISTASGVIQVERAVIGDRIECVISAAKYVDSDEIGTAREAHVIHLTVERIGAAK